MLRPVAFQHTIDMYEFCSKKLQAVLKVSPDDVQKKMDKALGRTQVSQISE